MGIVNDEDFQIVYSDTPGMLNPKYKLQEGMMKFVGTALKDADVILFVVEAGEKSENHQKTEIVSIWRQQLGPRTENPALRIFKLATQKVGTRSWSWLRRLFLRRQNDSQFCLSARTKQQLESDWNMKRNVRPSTLMWNQKPRSKQQLLPQQRQQATASKTAATASSFRQPRRALQTTTAAVKSCAAAAAVAHAA